MMSAQILLEHDNMSNNDNNDTKYTLKKLNTHEFLRVKCMLSKAKGSCISGNYMIVFLSL